MKNNYTVENFTMKKYSMHIEEEGRLCTYNGKYDINYSSILTCLIQNVGRFVENYASDLFIDWKRVVGIMENNPYECDMEDNVSLLFGLKKNGVDHKECVLNKISSAWDKYQAMSIIDREYRKIFRLDILKKEDRITMSLYEVEFSANKLD